MQFPFLLYFIDFIEQNRKANRLAFRLTFNCLVSSNNFFVFIYASGQGRFPVLTLFEGLYFYSWVLITFSLVIHKILRVDFTVFFTNIIGFSIMAIHAFTPIQRPSVAMAEQLVSELLFIHITMAILSYGAFSLSFVFSVLYLFQYKLLKERKWEKKIWRLSDLAKLEKMSNVLNAIGVPMLLLSLILGLQWAFIKLPVFQWHDPKIIGSLILLLNYSLILYLHSRKEMFGRKFATWNVAAFLIILINFFLISHLSSFHIWHY